MTLLPQAVYCKLSGRIGGEASVKLFKDIKEIIEENHGVDLAIDFRDVDFLDSSGLGVLVAINSTMIRKQRQFHLIAVPPNIMNILRVTNLHNILSIADEIGDIQQTHE